MACKKYREKIILHLYGELNEEDTKKLLEHVKECVECTEDLAYTEKVFHVLDETKTTKIPEAQWERSWNTINTEIKKRQSKQKSFLSFPKWGYAAAAMILVFLVGLYIGRIAFLPSQSKGAPLEGTQSAWDPTLQEHLESLKPVLVEYANYTGSEEKGTITMDKELVRSLIIQNILLKRMIAEKNPSVKQLLEDVDLVLREIANQEDDDTDTLAMIQELIQERGILYEIEVSRTI
jgi:hypothetical protein